MAIALRSVTMILGGVVLVAAGYEGTRYLCEWSRTKASLALWRAVQRIASLLGVTFILGELGGRAGLTTISWRTPLAFCVFCLVLASIVGIARTD